MSWLSLVNSPPFSTVLQGWLAFHGDEQVAPLPRHVDEQLALLLAHLQRQRCLLILDNVESVLYDSGEAVMWLTGYKPYSPRPDIRLFGIFGEDERTAILFTNRLELWPTHISRQTMTRRSTPHMHEEGGW